MAEMKGARIRAMHLYLIIKFSNLSITLESDAMRRAINGVNIALKHFQTNRYFACCKINRERIRYDWRVRLIVLLIACRWQMARTRKTSIEKFEKKNWTLQNELIFKYKLQITLKRFSWMIYRWHLNYILPKIHKFLFSIWMLLQFFFPKIYFFTAIKN